ncbi:MAG: ATP-dependent DNA ligase [Actinobacteria bacterium]|nr:ATP-dependent DNA ligase [Actinomycetota bacterium]
MALPFGPPIPPMLAKLQEDIPHGDGWLYEPKWDGFRAIVFRNENDVQIMSRDNKALNRYFPELERTLLESVPPDTVVDGEVVLSDTRGLDFDSLQLRIHPAASRVEMLSRQIPASFVAFDLLACRGKDLRDEPLGARCSELSKALRHSDAIEADATNKDVIAALHPGPRVVLTPNTADAAVCARWFDEWEAIGLDGVIAKRLDLPYVPKERVMVKVKHRRTADCVVGGYRLNKTGDGIGSLLLGLYDDGVLHYVGHTSSFKAAQRRELLAELKQYEGGHSFGGGRSPGGPSRWAQGRDTDWVPLEPVLVCEVSYDFLQGDRFRHAATFVRWRDDKKPEDCLFDQLPRRR